jgi:nitrite reductase/ring-hydroxylating ferredoxin subunit
VPEPSAYAIACDLIGGELDAVVELRPTVSEALARCRPGEVVPARRAGEEVAVVVLEDGRSYVVPDACPHDGRPLSDGFVERDRLVCARHGWEFEPATGRCVGRPAVCIRATSARILDREG